MTSEPQKPTPRPLEWVGSSRADLAAFPTLVRKEIGHSLHLVQTGERPRNAKPLRGFGGAGVLELIASLEGNTYRAVYTVKFQKAVFVLHAFQKKSKHGIATPKAEIDLIKQRLAAAADIYERRYSGGES